MSEDYLKSDRIWLKNHPTLDEKWVQNLVVNDPSILGLGDLMLKDKERKQPRAGRLDLLLQDFSDPPRRYEVELQLGSTDASHTIRTIEYWDIERKRYPQYDHCAVLVAEEVTSRFLNVISLFNGTIPLIVIQMQALKVGDCTTLVFTKVMDELSRGLVDEDEYDEAPATDRSYWENRATKEIVDLADKILEILRGFDSTLELKYNKSYIGLEQRGRPYNFTWFQPTKKRLNLKFRLPQDDDLDDEIEDAGFDALEYNRKLQTYCLRLTGEDIESKSDVLKNLIQRAYERYANS